MAKDPRTPLRDIIESSDRIISNVDNVSIEEFRRDINLQDAVVRRFEIIGEAVKRIPAAVRSRYLDVPWKEVAGFRDVLIHDYPDIVIDYVYATGKDQLPAFRDQIRRILDDLGPRSE